MVISSIIFTSGCGSSGYGTAAGGNLAATGSTTSYRVFITSSSYTPGAKTSETTFSGLAGADQICNQEAIKIGLTRGNWAAILSDSTTSAYQHLKDKFTTIDPTISVIGADGSAISGPIPTSHTTNCPSYSGSSAGNTTAPFDCLQWPYKTPSGPSSFWFGAPDPYSISSSSTCSNWTSATGTNLGLIGFTPISPSSLGAWNVNDTRLGCTHRSSLLCMQPYSTPTSIPSMCPDPSKMGEGTLRGNTYELSGSTFSVESESSIQLQNFLSSFASMKNYYSTACSYSSSSLPVYSWPGQSGRVPPYPSNCGVTPGTATIVGSTCKYNLGVTGASPIDGPCLCGSFGYQVTLTPQ